ncbi:hypothetical protein HDE_04200 [Halotydeus destructor]|nr:hypothetical protein HDE_04200 [Halotydeus destructor]
MESDERVVFLIHVLCCSVSVYLCAAILIEINEDPYLISSSTRHVTQFKLPAISVCVHTQLYDPNFETLTESKEDVFENNITFADHFKLNQYPALVEQCVVLQPNLNPMPCRRVTTPRVFISKQYVCYTYFLASETHEREYNMAVVDGFVMYALKVNVTGRPDDTVSLVVHNNDDKPMPTFGGSRSVDIDVNKTAQASVIVDITRIQMVNAPEDKCLDYKTRGFESKKDCFDQCIVETTANRTGRWPSQVFAAGDLYHRYQRSLMTLTPDAPDIKVRCTEKVCQIPDCFQNDYVTTVRNTVPRVRRNANKMLTIQIGTPMITMTTILYQKQMTFNVIMSSLGGLVSLWTGLSMASVFHLIWRLMFKIGAILGNRETKREVNRVFERRSPKMVDQLLTPSAGGRKRSIYDPSIYKSTGHMRKFASSVYGHFSHGARPVRELGHGMRYSRNTNLVV